MKHVKYRKNYQNMTQSHVVSKFFWKHGIDTLAQLRVATNLQFYKTKQRKKQHNVCEAH